MFFPQFAQTATETDGKRDCHLPIVDCIVRSIARYTEQCETRMGNKIDRATGLGGKTMNYRMAISIIILFAGCMAPVHIAGQATGQKGTASPQPVVQKSVDWQGGCGSTDGGMVYAQDSHPYGKIAESDGVQILPRDSHDPRQVQAAYAEAKAKGLTLGMDGFLWKITQVSCDELRVVQLTNGITLVAFMNDPKSHVLVFEGELKAGDAQSGAILFGHVVYLADFKPIPLSSGFDAGGRCQFTEQPVPPSVVTSLAAEKAFEKINWMTRISFVDCHANTKADDGHLYQVDVRFRAAKMIASKPAPDYPANHQP